MTTALEFLLVLVVLLAAIAIVGWPLRPGRTEQVEEREALELAELEAAKEAKYREIRDAEMDFRTGKLSKEDHRALDRQLRAEAIQLLRRIDALAPSAEETPPGPPTGPRRSPTVDTPRDETPSATMP